jgi:hypothetical protein
MPPVDYTGRICVVCGHKQIHRIKHMQFGQGFMSNHLSCHIFFPYLAIKDKGEPYLTHAEQEVWFDQVIIPSMKEVVESDILQHWPRSWSEAHNKAKVVNEIQLDGQYAPIRYEATVPPRDVQRLWQAICDRISRARRDSGIEVFRNPFLLVSGHNLKVQYRSSKRTSVQQQFLQDLEDLFDMEEDCWIDLGIEVTPILGTNEVYLLKSGCFDEWQRQFADYDSTNGVNGQIFNWFLTRDAGSTRVMMSSKHQLQRQGLSYVKYYNLHKDIFAAPLKKSRPYCFEHLEGLAVSESTVKSWYETRKAGISRPRLGLILKAQNTVEGYHSRLSANAEAFVQVKNRLLMVSVSWLMLTMTIQLIYLDVPVTTLGLLQLQLKRNSSEAGVVLTRGLPMS